MTKQFRWLFPCLALAGVPLAWAESDETFRLRGFGTVGAARSSSGDAEFVRDLSQTKGIKDGQWSGRIDSILGLQANWQALPSLEFVGQVVSRLHYDKSRDPEVMWAFAKWEPDPGIALRIGRIGADFMMLADSRLVGYSYLPVRPPVDFFGTLFFSHFDGVDLSLAYPVADGVLRGKLFGGKTQEKAAGAPGVWDTSNSPVTGFVVDYAKGPWQFRLNAANIRYATDINTFGIPALLRQAGAFTGVQSAFAAADSMGTEDDDAHYVSLGVVYESGPLQVQGMVNRIRQDSDVFEDSHAGYVLAGYRLGVWTPYAGVSRWKTETTRHATGLPDVPPFAALNQAYARYMAASRADQTTYTLGVRWDFYNNMALKLQWDALRGTPESRFPVANPGSGWKGDTDVVTAVMDFVF